MPPEHEVEFSIELTLGTKSILMAPCGMSAVELSKLKVKLKELVEKQFVRYSVSSWGAHVSLVKNNYGTMRLCVDYQ